MTDNVPRTHCDPTPPKARRIKLKDGRYMIFFEFGEGEKPKDQKHEEPDMPPSSDKTDV